MSPRLRAWLVVLTVALLCVGLVWFLDARRSHAIASKPALLARLPASDSIIVAIDFAALRRSGVMDLLANSKTPEEPEYKEFVRNTDFDYKQDLDLALASFGPQGKFFLLKGRFDWNRLSAYVRSAKGDCYNTMCRMVGSTPERKISFFPLRPEVMALAVSKDADAANQLLQHAPEPLAMEAPDDPLWVRLPPSALKDGGGLPTGTRIFAKSLENADAVVLSLGPEGQDFQARLAVNCRSEQDAAAVAAELERSTQLLRSMIEREHRTPNPRDLSGVLTAGTFHYKGRRVTGHWPLAHALIADTLGGS